MCHEKMDQKRKVAIEKLMHKKLTNIKSNIENVKNLLIRWSARMENQYFFFAEAFSSDE